MLRTIVGYGVLAGLIVGVPMIALMTASGGRPVGPWNMATGYALMLAAMTVIFVAVKRARDRRYQGIIRFWPAFGIGIGISVVASLLYVAAWDVALELSHVDFAHQYGQAVIAARSERGISPADLTALKASMAEFETRYADPLYRWPMTFLEFFPVGVLVSLVAATLLRDPRFLPGRRG